jgi:hypothetical protein
LVAKKDKAARLPKKVGGVKLSKQFRKSAGVVAELAQNPIAREVVSAALVAGASALAKRRVKGAGGQPGARKPGGELDSLLAQGKEVGNMFAQGVSAFLGELLKPADKTEATTPKPAPARRPAPKPAAGKSAAAPRAAPKPASPRPGARTKPAAKPKPTSN